MAKQITWTDSTRKLTELVPWERNPRHIKGANVKRLQESFEEFGQPEPVIIGPSNELYNGHQRLKSWLSRFGDVDVAVRVASRALTEKEREKLTVYLHKGATGEWDFDILANEFEIDELLEWGFEPFELGLGDSPLPTAEDPGPQVDRAEELRQKWGVEPGQLWKLGEHRLICGDCTDRAVVERVMGGERADLLMADPEYNAPMDWLSLSMLDAIPHWLIMAGDRQHAEILKTYGDRFNQFFVIFFRQFSWNLNVYIPILQHVCIAHFRSIKAKNYDLKGLHSVIECASKFDRDSEHPHAKHVEIVSPFVVGFSPDRGIVIDLFSGSGTTIIACENLGRRCRAVEIAPGYVAVALQRWADMTGQTPELVNE